MEEEMTQGDPTAIAIYALGITLVLAWQVKNSKENTNILPSRHVTFADDSKGTGTPKT